MNPLAIDKNLKKYFFVLYKLAEAGARNRAIKASTKYLAEKMDLSQQSVSRYLIDLERHGWITRAGTREGGLIRITALGEDHLRKVRIGLNTIFERKHPSSVAIEGIVFSGLGEGAYYVTKDPYRRQFIEKLGYDPYPGTLNLRITSEHDIKIKEELENYPRIEIDGFKNEDRTYGPVKCLNALLNNKEKGTVVFAFRTHYARSVLEIISPICLRERLNLKDGNKVKLEIYLKNDL